MLYHYLKISIRALSRQQVFTAIKVVGLALGFSCFLIISQYVAFEKSYDNFHKQPEDIYRIATTRYSSGEVFSKSTAAMPPLRPLIEAGLPQIEKVTRVYLDGNSTVLYDHPGGKRVFNEEKVYYADEPFFEVFGFPLLQGDPLKVLDDPREMVISQSIARKYFNDEDPVGKILTVTSTVSTDYVVSGVFEDAPQNSHFKPDMLFSYSTFIEVIRPGWGVEQNLLYNGFRTYVRAPDTSAEELTVKIDRLAHQAWGARFTQMDIDYDFFAQPIRDIHTKSHLEKEFEVNMRESVLDWLGYIGLIILLIALVNYFNLSSAHNIEKAKEVGLRKVFGASIGNLRFRFQTEAMLMNIVAIVLSIFLFSIAQWLLSENLNIYYPRTLNTRLLVTILALFLVSIAISAYPALFVSKTHLTKLIQGRLKARAKGKLLTKGLLLFQLTVTPLLMAGSYLIQLQTKHLINQDLGIDTEKTLVIKVPRNVSGDRAVAYDGFKQRIEQKTGEASLSLSALLPGQDAQWASRYSMYGDSAQAKYMKSNLIEYEFEKVMGLELVAGRAFDRGFSDSSSIMINESAARLWGYEPEDIIGRRFSWRFSPVIQYDRTVIGVIKDYQQNLNSEAKMPIAYGLNRYCPSPYHEKHFLLKINGPFSQFANTIEHVRTEWQQSYPYDPFNFKFLNSTFNELFQREQQMLTLLKVFTFISVVLAFLGLYGFSSLLIQQRTREIGIRKVLGAGVYRLTRLLSKDFLLIALVAYVIAIPIMILGGTQWLQNYEIRVSLNKIYFLFPLAATIMVVAVGTIGRTMAVALKNPIDSLRQE